MNAQRMGIVVIGLAALIGAVYLLAPGEEAEASLNDLSTSELVAVITGDGARNRKLMAMEELRQKTDGIAALEKIGKGSDPAMAVMSTTFLGKAGGSDAKASLKALLENEDLGTEVRKGAMTAIATRFGTDSDYSYLESKSKDDGKLKAHYGWLVKEVKK